MSDHPGNQLPPRDRPPGDRPRNRNRSRNNRRPRENDDRRPRSNDRPRQDNPRADRPRKDGPREDRGPRRSRDRSRPDKKPAPAAAKLTLGQKLLAILTFGLVRPKGPAKPAPRRDQQSPRPERKPAIAVPPVDPDTVTTERLHVGNLHYDANEDDLLDIFKGIGPVQSVDIVYSGNTHRSKGFGFVQFMALSDAKRAVQELHGQNFMGRPLLLGPARSRGRDDREADDDPQPAAAL